MPGWYVFRATWRTKIKKDIAEYERFIATITSMYPEHSNIANVARQALNALVDLERALVNE